MHGKSYLRVDNLNCTTPIIQQSREFPLVSVMPPVLSLSPNTEGNHGGQRTSFRVVTTWLGQSVSDCHLIHQKVTPILRFQIISHANFLSGYFHPVYSFLPIEIGLLTCKISHWGSWRHPTLKHIGYSQFKTDKQKRKKRLTQRRATFLCISFTAGLETVFKTFSTLTLTLREEASCPSVPADLVQDATYSPLFKSCSEDIYFPPRSVTQVKGPCPLSLTDWL